MSLIARIIGWLLKALGPLLNRGGPSPEAQAADRAARAETKLEIEEKADADTLAAIDAARSVADRDRADPARLRDDGDPDCRDCTAAPPR